MTDVTASRTLVKSPPELWTECSQAETLGRHLDSFGEIRITRLEPETAVAWEGERASGTVRLEPSGWGTRVVMTATSTPHPVAVGPAPEPAGGPPAPQPHAALPAGARRGGWLGWLFGRREAMAARDGPPVAEPGPAPAPAPPLEAEAVLGAALESLGRAHHRPFSR